MASDQGEPPSSVPRWVPWVGMAVALIMLLGSWALVTMEQTGVPQIFVVEHESSKVRTSTIPVIDPPAPPPERVRAWVDKTFGPKLPLEEARRVIDPFREEIVRCYVLTDARVVLTVDFRVTEHRAHGVEVRPRARHHARFRSCVEAVLEAASFESVAGERPSFVTLVVGAVEE